MDTNKIWDPLGLGGIEPEEILYRVNSFDALANLVPHPTDAWSVEFPSLDILPKPEGEPVRLRICIATEDIVGPVRNGGIGTTYSALAELLARLGHEVTILYLKGHEVENGTIDQWIAFYAAKSIRFVPAPNYAAADRFQTGAERNLHAPYNMLKYLTKHPMDVVHVSEWRGSGYLSLLAKRQNLAFQETLFIVKTSAPWIWNRLYGLQPLDQVEDLARVHAERRSVEFADMVIGGSLHLLRWMSSQGYRIPRDRTFVQPNVATFDHLSDLMTQRDWARGERHPVDEIVFFGRLEARKGLMTFVQAIKRLLRQGSVLPRQITFMGKPGARLMARPDQDIVDYIKSETASWPTTVEILSEFQQYEALQYLVNGPRLAVMPSMIENSSLAVYEAAICGIPFIASTSGGTPELIASADHAEVLCDSHPIPLATMIGDALLRGGYVARPSFDNDANLEQWRQFHLDLGRGLLQKLLPPAREVTARGDGVSVCIYHADTDGKLRATLVSVKEQDHPAAQVLIAVDTDDMSALARARTIADEIGLPAQIIPTFDLDAGQSFNVLVDQAHGDFAFFLWAGATIRPMALRALTKVVASSNADLVNYFFRVTHEGEAASKDYLSAIVFGNVAQSFFRADFTSLPLLVRRRTFAALGGFTSDYRVLAHDHELVAKAQISGVHCETALLELGTVPAWDEHWLRTKCYDPGEAHFRAIRPELAATPLALRELLLMAKGLQKSTMRRGRPLGKRPGVLEAAGRGGPPPTSGTPTQVEPRAVARRAARIDRVTAREAGLRGAGLMQWIDQLPIDAVEPGIKAPSSKRALVSDPRSPMSEVPTMAPIWLSNVASRKYSGNFLGIHQGIAYGWVKNEDRPRETVEIELIDTSGRARVVRADGDLATAMPLPKAIRGHGFSVPLWMGWQGLHRFRQSRKLLMRVKGTDVALGEMLVMGNPRHLEKAGFDGYCDLVDATVRGWVWQPSHPEKPVDVSIFIDGMFFARQSAADSRADLRAVHVGSGSYGFAVSLPPQLRDGTPRRIDVVVADAGVFLKRGRLLLVGNKLTVL